MRTSRYFANIFSISPKFSGYSVDRIYVLSILLWFVLVFGGLWGQMARADDVLILEETVTSPAINSLEYQTAVGLGFGVDVVDSIAWAALSAGDFGTYRAIILGDRHCTGVGAIIAAVANNSTWGPEIDGNIVLIGTDPVFHKTQGGQTLTEKAMAFATDELLKTGAYITLSCYYNFAAANTPVPLLDELSNLGGFTVTSVGCFNNAHIVATHPALAGLVDGDLSNWNCSVHEAFDSWPGDFMVLAIAHDNSGIYTANDGTVGTPYILARGDGLEPVSSPGLKWQQLPDETRNGMDIRMDRDATAPRILADDFLCTQAGLITDVRFWGSWEGDAKSSLTKIHLSIHGDIPADPCDPASYSRPGTLYWSADFFPGDFTETLYKDLCDPCTSDCIYEWWWDPYSSAAPNPSGDQKIWEYHIAIDPNFALMQEGTAADPLIYWLDIYVETDNTQGFDAYFGWKTARTHWNDDAVYEDLSGIWQELRYPNPHPFEPNSIDLAFEIGTQPLHEPEEEACCFPDGSCLDLPPAQCLDDGGFPQGAGTDCTGVDCLLPDPNEACCLPDGSCIYTSWGDCMKRGGTPQGTGTLCSDPGIDCISPCIPEPNDCPDGTPPLLMSINIGSHDNFAPGPDVGAAPDTILLNYIINCSAPGIPLQLDEIPGEAGVPADSWFGHTFDALPPMIIGATLEFRARATTGGGSFLTFNDHIAFVDTISGCSPTWSWQNRFENLPEALGTWNAGQVATFCLDLDALPIGNTAATTSVISQLASGSLSILVDDDTGIDYVLLTIAVCPCEYPANMEIAVEVPDGFMAPDSAPAAPSPELVTAFGPGFRGFDQILSNRRFGHTFTNLPPNILAAELEIGLRAGTDIPTNDTIALEFLNPTFRWAKRIEDLPIIPPGTGAPIGAWPVGTMQVFILDLDDLPPSTASVTSVLADMADGDLDVYIQDDTAVNYMILRLEVCCDSGIPGDSDNDGDVDLSDVVIMALHWLWGVKP